MSDPGGHDIRLVPSDPAKTHAARDEWRTECSCGWAGPPDAGQGPACEHWLAHMRDLALADDDATPMTRTELAMLWDLLGRWQNSHPERSASIATHSAGVARVWVDAELAERFGS